MFRSVFVCRRAVDVRPLLWPRGWSAVCVVGCAVLLSACIGPVKPVSAPPNREASPQPSQTTDRRTRPGRMRHRRLLPSRRRR